jgi:hypothetical protein
MGEENKEKLQYEKIELVCCECKSKIIAHIDFKIKEIECPKCAALIPIIQ